MQGIKSSQMKLSVVEKVPRGLKLTVYFSLQKRNDKSFRLNMRETSEKLHCSS